MFRPVLEKLGLDRLELVISGGAPLPPETMALWQMWGVNVLRDLRPDRGSAAPSSPASAGPFPRRATSAPSPPAWKCGSAPSGEILVRGEFFFDGYWNNPEATREVLGDGRLAAHRRRRRMDRRPLKLVDRARDFIVTSGGKTLSPSFIENLLRASPYVAEAMVIGHARKYLTALIEIDFDTVSDWARARRHRATPASPASRSIRR